MHGRNDVAILVDVDKTLVISGSALNEEIHLNLIRALADNKIKQLYLFTKMSMNEIRDKLANPGYLARPDVIKALNDAGIDVLGVITPADLHADMAAMTDENRLGCVYRAIYQPQYDRYENGELTGENYYQDEGFNNARKHFDELNYQAQNAAKLEGTSVKKLMHDFFIKQSPKIQYIVMLDDDEKEMDPILNGQAPVSAVKTTCVMVDEKDKKRNYKSEIHKALSSMRKSPSSSVFEFLSGRSRSSTPVPDVLSTSTTPEIASSQSDSERSTPSHSHNASRISPQGSLSRSSSNKFGSPIPQTVQEEGQVDLRYVARSPSPGASK